MFFMGRNLITLIGFCTILVSGMLFIQRQEPSGAYLFLTHRTTSPRYLDQQLRLPDGQIFRDLSTSAGIFVAWTPDGNAFFNHRNDGLYIYDVKKHPNRLVVETPVHQRSPLSLQYLPNTIELAPDGKRFLFHTQSTVYSFDLNGNDPQRLFFTSGEVSSASWDGQWATVAFKKGDGEWHNVNDPSQRQAPQNVNNFELSTNFGVIEMDLPNWRVGPNGSEESIPLRFPDGQFSVSGWLTYDTLLISERIEDSRTRRMLYLMDIDTLELTQITELDDVWTTVQGFISDNRLILLYGTSGGFAAYQIPLSTLEPSLIFKDCKQLRLVDDDRQVTTRWWDHTVDIVFCAVEERSRFSFHRYDLKEANRQLLFSTPGIAGNNYFDLSPDRRSLIIGYQDLGHITDYQYHLVTVDVKSGQVREIVLNQKPQVF